MIESTAASCGGALRERMVCSACASAVATMIGSLECCGDAPCEPTPLMRISKKSAPAIATPGLIPTTPGSV